MRQGADAVLAFFNAELDMPHRFPPGSKTISQLGTPELKIPLLVLVVRHDLVQLE